MNRTVTSRRYVYILYPSRLTPGHPINSVSNILRTEIYKINFLSCLAGKHIVFESVDTGAAQLRKITVSQVLILRACLHGDKVTLASVLPWCNMIQ